MRVAHWPASDTAPRWMWATDKLDLVNARHSPELPETGCGDIRKYNQFFILLYSQRVVKVSFEKVLLVNHKHDHRHRAVFADGFFCM